ncbi:MAG: helix-turn-helix domain-containing protein [Candidatus Binatia bacterium]
MDIAQAFGKNVKRLREQRNWSQEQLAERSGLHRTYISGIERGARNPTILIAAKLAQALNVHPADLFVGEQKK